MKEEGERVKAKQEELGAVKVNFTKVESQLARQESDVREGKKEVKQLKGEVDNLTNTLKSVEEEGTSLKRDLEAVEVEKKNVKESLEALKRKVKETALVEEQQQVSIKLAEAMKQLGKVEEEKEGGTKQLQLLQSRWSWQRRRRRWRI